MNFNANSDTFDVHGDCGMKYEMQSSSSGTRKTLRETNVMHYLSFASHTHVKEDQQGINFTTEVMGLFPHETRKKPFTSLVK